MTFRSSELVTQTAPPPTARAVGVTPTVTVCTTRFVSGSMRETVPSSEFATQTAPGPTAMPLGSRPTSIRCTTTPVSGSTRETVPSSPFVTHTEPSPTATLVGPLPTGTSATSRFDPASIAATEFAEAEVSPGLSSPASSMTATATAAGGGKRRRSRSGRRFCGELGRAWRAACSGESRGGATGAATASDTRPGTERATARLSVGDVFEELAVDRLGLGRGVGAELLVEEVPALLVDLERLCPIPGGGVRVHEAPVAALAKRLECDCLLGPRGRLRGFAGAQAGVCEAVERAIEDVCQLAALLLDPGSILTG